MEELERVRLQGSGGRLGAVYAAVVALAFVDLALGVYAALKGPFPLMPPIGAPTAYRNIYIHIPMAWASYILYTGAFVSALLYLKTSSEKWDRYVRSFVLLGTVYAAFTLVSGMAWASESWGKAWTWDPRETAVLLLLLAYLVYFVLRSSIPDPDRAASLSAAYAVAAYSMVPVSFLAPRLAESFHPTSSEFGQFMGSPEVMAIFGPKVLISTVMALLLAYATAQRLAGAPAPGWLRPAALLLIAAGVASGAYVALPYLSGGVDRVVSAGLTADGKLAWVELAHGGRVEFNPPIESPVQPASVDVNGTVLPSIVKHVVSVSDGSLRVVTHWSVALNLAAYAVATGVVLLLLSSRRLPRSISGSR
ncbi:MAG: cytochrome c biogenesis protein CcsA [Crenarchaeota archaeon]|nr:cytochrome c biogenesis protein CcsA [Thermoproteota archaeon]